MFIIIRIVKFENPKDLSSPVEYEEYITLKPDEPFTIGRSRSCTLKIPDEYTSSKHSEFTFTGEKLFVQDLISKNGTKVNGIKVDIQTQLYAKDIIVIGSTFIHIDSDKTPSDALKKIIRPEDGAIDMKVLKEYNQVTNTIDKDRG